MFKGLIKLLFLICISPGIWAANPIIPLDKAPIDLSDYASLQRGAKLFFNYCSGCHGIHFMRYDSLARGLEITDEDGEILKDVVKNNLMFATDKLSDPISTAMGVADASKWFGMPPPDLSLVARSRGVDWLYTYLRTFYVDPKRPWGVNNLVFPDVAMPHAMLDLQGKQMPNYSHGVIDSLELVEAGLLRPQEFDSAVGDLVNFLSFVGEPVQLERRRIGGWVLVLLGVFLIFSYLLKREYWKDVH